jgi:hypothetical protein
MFVMDHPWAWMVNVPFTPGAKNAKNPLYSQLVLRPVVEGNERRRFCFINQVYLRERN